MRLNHLFVVDDRPDGSDSARATAEFCRLSFDSFESPTSAEDRLLQFPHPFVLVLDHNFPQSNGESIVGYDLCKTVRMRHPYGLLLPIIYLSGFETPQGFVDRTQLEPAYAPTVYLNKDQSQQLTPIVKKLRRNFDALIESTRKWLDDESM